MWSISWNLSQVVDYRSITILSHISKTFEALVLNSVQPSVNNSIFINEQHGFRPCLLTVIYIIHFYNYIQVFNAFAVNTQVDVIYTDFSKVFDSVNHKVLIALLQLSRFCDPLLSWFEPFSPHRPQWVKLFGEKSNLFIISSGVLQGGHLSPMLFSLSINYAKFVLQHCYLLFIWQMT